MRIVGLDLGASHIEFCEAEGRQGPAAVGTSIRGAQAIAGAGHGAGTRGVRGCREGWRVYDSLVEWGHEAVMIDTTRVKQIGVGQHRRKNDAIDAEVIGTKRWSQGGIRRRTCFRPLAETFEVVCTCEPRWWKPGRSSS